MTRNASRTEPPAIPVTVTFRHVPSSDALREYATAKVSKLARFLHNPLEAQVVLNAEKNRQLAEISLLADGLTVIGRFETADMQAAIDGALDKIDVQLRRSRERRRTRRGRERRRGASVLDRAADTGERPDAPRIVRRERAAAKPMTPEDAALELAASDRSFIVFRDQDTETLRVVYRLDDGNLGLIDT